MRFLIQHCRYGLILVLCFVIMTITPAQDNTAMVELAQGNTAFAFDLYHTIQQNVEGNIIFSPYSISSALAMTVAGARGETERQMRQTLHFSLPPERLHPAFRVLDLELASRADAAGTDPNDDWQGLKLNIANAIWAQQGFPFRTDYLRLLEENYGAGMRPVDFAGAPNDSRIEINDWVAEQTEDRIQDLIPPSLITPDTTLVLTNAIYFNATWLSPFNATNTQDDDFTLLDDSTVTVPMMKQIMHYPLVDQKEYIAVELPYSGEEVSLLILMPNRDNFSEFEQELSPRILDGIISKMEETTISLHVPKLEGEFDVSLSDALVEMGMRDAFGAADFSGMSNEDGLFISEVLHKAFLTINEKGTEAAAATAVIVTRSGPPPEIIIDHPFLFFIIGKPTGTILFMGRVLNPTE